MARLKSGRKPTFLFAVGGWPSNGLDRGLGRPVGSPGRDPHRDFAAGLPPEIMVKSQLEDRIRLIAERVVADMGGEVVDVDFLGAGQQRLLRVFLDKPAGITHQDCEMVSRQLSAILDAEDVIPGSGRYTLEVSSPGLDRRLVKREDFLRFAGRKVRLQMRPRAGSTARRRYSGVLLGCAGERVRVCLAESGEEVEFAREEIERANLVPTP